MASKHAPRIVGTGLVALDVVCRERSDTPIQIATGGTCGNVLTILAYLGWQALPLARLADDPARAHIRAELHRWGLDTTRLAIEPLSATPIIVERLMMPSHEGVPSKARHSFSLICPSCGQWLPRYSPVVVRAMRALVDELPAAEVFFFDRLAPSTLELAMYYEARGALIVFEPSAGAKKAHFDKALKIAHIVKYADERMECLPGSPREMPRLLLEVQTRGSHGLRYRSALLPGGPTRWHSLRAFPVSQLVDTVGCGDWCTAGLLSRVGSRGTQGMRSLTPKEVRDALQYGQALAAWNCGFVGARGGMLDSSISAFTRDIADILDHRDRIAVNAQPRGRRDLSMAEICPTCHKGERAHRPRART